MEHNPVENAVFYKFRNSCVSWVLCKEMSFFFGGDVIFFGGEATAPA